MDKELTNFLNKMLDNPTDRELYDDYIEVLKSRSVYSFMSVLNRISYARIPELLEITNKIIKEKFIPIQKEPSIVSEASSSSEEEDVGYKTGTAFDLLTDE
jgi:hypothetical protein